jgi:hypothetical protein
MLYSVACSDLSYASEAESMLTQPVSWLLSACTSFQLVSSTAILVGYAVLVGWTLGVRALKGIRIRTSLISVLEYPVLV